jgi:hypothetical protein
LPQDIRLDRQADQGQVTFAESEEKGVQLC